MLWQSEYKVIQSEKQWRQSLYPFLILGNIKETQLQLSWMEAEAAWSSFFPPHLPPPPNHPLNQKNAIMQKGGTGLGQIHHFWLSKNWQVSYNLYAL